MEISLYDFLSVPNSDNTWDGSLLELSPKVIEEIEEILEKKTE